MKEIQGISHIACSIDEANSFYNSINDTVKKMQSEGWEVEIQYQQSDKLFSAIIIAKG